MEHTYLKARAKINVALDVLRKRDDGYHEMRMILQTLRLYDGLFIKKIEKASLKLVCNLKWLPTDGRNLAYSAAKFLIDKYEIKHGVFIELTKNIPVSAGLGGGSSDCAATLIGMRRLFELPITDEELRDIGKSFGADVPFCLLRGTALAEGIGERLTPICRHPEVLVLLAKPPASVSTASVFNKLDVCAIKEHPNIDKIIIDIGKGDIKAVADGMGNVLEDVTAKMHGEIYRLKDIMLKSNALGSLMSGSGPTVFGYFTSKKDVQKAVMKIREDLPSVKEIYMTSTYNPIMKRNG